MRLGGLRGTGGADIGHVPPRGRHAPKRLKTERAKKAEEAKLHTRTHRNISTLVHRQTSADRDIPFWAWRQPDRTSDQPDRKAGTDRYLRMVTNLAIMRPKCGILGSDASDWISIQSRGEWRRGRSANVNAHRGGAIESVKFMHCLLAQGALILRKCQSLAPE